MEFLTDLLFCPDCSSVERAPCDAGDACVCGGVYDRLADHLAAHEPGPADVTAFLHAVDRGERTVDTSHKRNADGSPWWDSVFTEDIYYGWRLARESAGRKPTTTEET